MKPSLAPRVSKWTEGENCRNVERAGERKADRNERERERENSTWNSVAEALRYSTSVTRNFPPENLFSWTRGEPSGRIVGMRSCLLWLSLLLVVLANRSFASPYFDDGGEFWSVTIFSLAVFDPANRFWDTRGKIRIRMKRVKECRESFWHLYHCFRIFAFCHHQRLVGT